MARTPTVSGDSGTWGTILNDYLAKSPGHFEFVLDGAVSASDTSITVNKDVDWMAGGHGLLAIIDPGKATTEIRRAATLSATTVTFPGADALAYDHADESPVVFITTDNIDPWWFGAKGDGSTDDWAALQRCQIECGRLDALWVNGMRRSYKVSQPLVTYATRMKNIILSATAGYSPNDTTNAMLMMAQDAPKTFTASASTDTFTTPSAHGIGGAGNLVVFSDPTGETLPGGITSGKVYYVKTVPTSTTFTISATAGGATLDITSDGTGIVHPDVHTLTKAFLDDVHLSLGTDMNGILSQLQQPSYVRNLRIDMGTASSGGAIGWTLSGQICNVYNAEFTTKTDTIGIVLGPDATRPAEGINFFGLNMVGSTTGTDIGVKFNNALGNSITGLWTESIGDFGSGYHIYNIGVGTQISGWGAWGHGTPIYNSSNQTSAQINGFYAYGAWNDDSSTQTVVDDAGRSATITTADSDARAFFGNLTFNFTDNTPIVGDQSPNLEAWGTSTQTPGAVTSVTIAHGLTLGGTGQAPTGFTVTPADSDSRDAPAFHVTADSTNLTLTFASALTAATAYSWNWSAKV